MVAGSNLSWQGIKRKAVYTKGAGPVWYEAVYTGRECTGWGIETWGCKIFKLVFKIDQSETTKSHMFSTSFRLTNHK